MKKIIFVSSYPEKNCIHGNKTVGVASYAKNTLMALQKAANNKLDITVLAEKLEGEMDYKQHKIEVKRVWKRNSLLAFPTILKYIANNDASTVTTEFELAMFGNPFYLLPLPLFLLLLKLMRKKTVVVLHQVLPSVESIGPHIDISSNSAKGLLVGMMLPLFYRFLLKTTDKVIVFEDGLREKLARFGSIKKVTVIPHGVEHFDKQITKKQARQKLNLKQDDFVVLIFGFLAWYKGTDWILHAVNNLKFYKNKKNIKLIIAGGPNPNRTDKEYYMRYVAGVMREAEEIGARITGFVPENQIAEYYKASDVVLLPYRTHMSSSGPLSMAFGFEKPFLISHSLRQTLQDDDISLILKQLHIAPEKLLFTEENFSKRLQAVQNNKTLRNKLSLLSKAISRKRDWAKVGERYYEALC